MRISALACAAIILFGLPCSVTAQRMRVPVRVQYGWSTSYQDLARVPADSVVLEESKEKDLDLCFVYDEFWLIFPFWSRGGTFAVHQTVAPPKKADSFWIPEKHDVQTMARMLNLPEDRFKKPFFYYCPFGWLVIVASFLFVGLTSGPSPEVRFARLWSDERYRTAIANLLGIKGRPLQDPFEPIVLEGAPPDGDVSFGDEVEKLGDLGLSRRKARRDLEFLLLFLANNGGFALAEDPPPSDGGQCFNPEEKPGVGSDS